MPPAAAGYSAGEHNCGGVISTGRRSGTKGRGGAGKTTTVPSSNDGCDLDTIESNMCHACARPPAPTHAAGTPKSTSPLPGDHTVCFFARISRGTTRGRKRERCFQKFRAKKSGGGCCGGIDACPRLCSTVEGSGAGERSCTGRTGVAAGRACACVPAVYAQIFKSAISQLLLVSHQEMSSSFPLVHT